MRTYVALILLVVLASCSTPETETTKIVYPETKKVDQVDNYHGTDVSDPYRWLEDDNSEETAAWVEAQNKVTFGYLEKIPFRNALKERLEQIWDYPKYGTPFKKGGNYFFFKNSSTISGAITCSTNV